VTLVAVLAATPLTRPDAVAQARQSYEPTEARQTDETAGLRQSDRAAEAAGDRGVGGEPEESALALARRTKQPVEVTALRSETRQVFAEPDGTLVLEQHPRPVRVRKQGRWQDVDTTLTTRPDGSVAPVATAVDLSFSGGGTSPLARMARGAKALELGWQGALPTPVLDGDTATYPEVLPGVDLSVRADVDGFSHLLVVKTPEAARNPGGRVRHLDDRRNWFVVADRAGL
jgi:hypothetical protein